jgi:hypothetical protein
MVERLNFSPQKRGNVFIRSITRAGMQFLAAIWLKRLRVR